LGAASRQGEGLGWGRAGEGEGGEVEGREREGPKVLLNQGHQSLATPLLIPTITVNP